jgi:hypothetical protein
MDPIWNPMDCPLFQFDSLWKFPSGDIMWILQCEEPTADPEIAFWSPGCHTRCSASGYLEVVNKKF